MARVAGETNGGVLKVAIGVASAFFLVIVGMLSYWISQQNQVLEETRSSQNQNGNRLTAIETRLGRMESDIRDLRED